MKNKVPKRRPLNDTVSDLIKAGKLTQQELDEARDKALPEPEWQMVVPPKSASAFN